MRDRSSEMPPPGALTWPSSEEPTPKAMTGTRCSAQSAHDLLTSSAVSGNDHAVRRLQRNVGGGVGMLLAQRLAGLETLTETLFEDAKHGAMPASLRSTV